MPAAKKAIQRRTTCAVCGKPCKLVGTLCRACTSTHCVCRDCGLLRPRGKPSRPRCVACVESPYEPPVFPVPSPEMDPTRAARIARYAERAAARLPLFG